MQKKRILVVDDEPIMKDFLCEALQRKNYAVEWADNGHRALQLIQERPFDLVISDIRMPDLGGMELLKAAKTHQKDLGVILITAYGTIENAVEAIKAGAYDYITKPISVDEFDLTVEKYFEYQSLLTENKPLRSKLGRRYSFDNIIGQSAKMQKVFELIETVANSKVTVLIQGESGTGKELVARAIHYNSPRQKAPFIPINCAALPEGLIETELFGHEKGAFTGAIRTTKGRFELADGGTILLDEIGEISPPLQSKLLRVLQEGQFQKVGNPAETIRVDVRVIATTNKDLREEIRKGRFREDLYYRLSVVPMWLPPLRERRDDIPLLVEHFIRTFAKENDKPVEGISDEALRMLVDYHWPGNVRELQNYIYRAVVMAQERILTTKDFRLDESHAPLLSSQSKVQQGQTIEDMERELILATLRQVGNNRTRAAEKLGISVRTLRNKLREYRQAGYCIGSTGE